MAKASLIEKVKQSANRTTMRHYRSQPLPESYSKPFRFAVGNPQPSIMQQAFLTCLLNG